MYGVPEEDKDERYPSLATDCRQQWQHNGSRKLKKL